MSGAIQALAGQPIFGLALTLSAYALAATLHRRAGGACLLHPVLTASAAVALTLTATGFDYAVYRAQTFPLHVALGVVIVLLAVPLWRQFALIRAASVAILAALAAGVSLGTAAALAYPFAQGAPGDLLATLASSGATIGVAVSLAHSLGGAPALAGLVVIASAVLGSTLGPPLLARAGVTDERAAGFALGVAAHVLGVARALQISERAGAFASLGLVLNAGATILLIPLVLAALP